MPWWGILALVPAIFVVLFIWMMLGMGAGEWQANIFLVSVVAFAALIYIGVRWSVPTQKEKDEP